MRTVRERIRRLEESSELEPMTVVFMAENGSETVGTLADMRKCDGIFLRVVGGGDGIGLDLLRYIWGSWGDEPKKES